VTSSVRWQSSWLMLLGLKLAYITACDVTSVMAEFMLLMLLGLKLAYITALLKMHHISPPNMAYVFAYACDQYHHRLTAFLTALPSTLPLADDVTQHHEPCLHIAGAALIPGPSTHSGRCWIIWWQIQWQEPQPTQCPT
jgi:hypothetical protein